MVVSRNDELSIHDRFFVLDLDRCLINDRLYDIFDETVIESGIVDVSLLNTARAAREATGGSFDTVGWLKTEARHRESAYTNLLDSFIEKAHRREQAAYLSPGAESLLAALKTLSVPHMIMTYGGSEYQKAKIEAARLGGVPYLVVDHKYKARFMRGWWNDHEQCFTVRFGDAVIQARQVVLIDDKPSAFDELLPAPQARGYWLKAKELLPSQRGLVPQNVLVIDTLAEVLTHENL